MLLVLRCCDRCKREVTREQVGEGMVTEPAPLFSVYASFAPVDTAWRVLCDECRRALVGYLAAALKLDRERLLEASAVNDPVPEPPAEEPEITLFPPKPETVAKTEVVAVTEVSPQPADITL
jgi:hypothetical protein